MATEKHQSGITTSRKNSTPGDAPSGPEKLDPWLSMLREHAQIKNGEKILNIIASENSHKNYLRYEDRSFDAVIGNQVLQFFPYKIQLLREVIRILKPRGRLVLNVFSRIELCPCHLAVLQALTEQGGEIEEFRTPFSLYDPIELGDLVADSGFKEISVVRKTHEERFVSIRDFISTLDLSSDIAETVWSDYLKDFIDADGLRVLTTSNFLFARVS